MFKVVSNGSVIGYQTEPWFIKRNPESGAYIRAEEEDAQGISVSGVPYNLPGHTEITQTRTVDEESGETEEHVAPEAYWDDVDEAEILQALQAANEDNAGKIGEVDDTSTASLAAVTELYEQLVEKGVI